MEITEVVQQLRLWLKFICCSFEILSVTVHAWVIFALTRIVVLWCNFFVVVVSLSNVNKTWTIQKGKGEDVGWLSEAAFLSSSCCRFLSHTAGIYVTAACTHSFPLCLPPTPLLIPVYACERINFTPLHTGTLIQMSRQHLCLRGVWRGYDLPSSQNVTVLKSQSAPLNHENHCESEI